MRVLFLCTHNSSRSQMAEGLLWARGGNRYRAFSAGTHPRSVHPLAVKVMAELGIDIGEAAGHRAKGIEEFSSEPPMDLVGYGNEKIKNGPFDDNRQITALHGS
jgi:arsenate reductase